MAPSAEMLPYELAAIAHIVLAPALLDGRRMPKLSPAGRALLSIALGSHDTLRYAPLAVTLVELRVVRHIPTHYRDEPAHVHLLQCTRRARYRDVLRLAQRLDRLPLSELAFFGPPEIVLDCVGATLRPARSKTDRLLELAEASAA